jgi:predicted aspartyl protease
VSAAVNSSEMNKSLLGMSYLDRYQRIEMSADSLKIYR